MCATIRRRQNCSGGSRARETAVELLQRTDCTAWQQSSMIPNRGRCDKRGQPQNPNKARASNSASKRLHGPPGSPRNHAVSPPPLLLLISCLIVAPDHQELFQSHWKHDALARSLRIPHQLQLRVELREAVLHQEEEKVQPPHRALVRGGRQLGHEVHVERLELRLRRDTDRGEGNGWLSADRGRGRATTREWVGPAPCPRCRSTAKFSTKKAR